MSKIAARILSLILCLYAVPNAMPQQPATKSPPSSFSRSQLDAFKSLSPIDTHAHVFQSGPLFLAMLDRLNLHVLDIPVVDDTTPDRTLEKEKPAALAFIAASHGRARLSTTFDPFGFNHPNFAQHAVDGINQDFAHGAVAVKIWKNVGMELKDSAGKYVLPDDPRLEPIYKDIAAHHKTLIAHLAEPDYAWQPKDPESSYAKYYIANPQWDMAKKPDAPPKSAVIQARDHLLALNPDLRVVGAHLGSLEDSVDELAARLARYANFAVDTAARVHSLAAQPRDKVRTFVLRYQDRILYGTDLNSRPGKSDETVAQGWEATYAQDWRYFATNDTFVYQGHPVQGLDLPRSVLKKLYHDNAVHWIPGIVAVP